MRDTPQPGIPPAFPHPLTPRRQPTPTPAPTSHFRFSPTPTDTDRASLVLPPHPSPTYARPHVCLPRHALRPRQDHCTHLSCSRIHFRRSPVDVATRKDKGAAYRGLLTENLTPISIFPLASPLHRPPPLPILSVPTPLSIFLS